MTSECRLLFLQEPGRENDGQTETDRIHHRGLGFGSGNTMDERNGSLYHGWNGEEAKVVQTTDT